MLYGIVAFLISFLCALSYLDDNNRKFSLYLSCFFAGLCVASKYEFIPYLLVIFYIISKGKSLKFVDYYYSFLAILFVPVFCFGLLFLQGLTLNDLHTTFLTLKKISQTKTLHYFYLTQGVYFHIKTIPVILFDIAKTLIPLCLFVYAFRVSAKAKSVLLFLFSLVLMFYSVSPVTFIFLPIFVSVLTLINFKNISKNIHLFVLALSCIAISLKSFWGLATLNYGVYFAGFLMITSLALIFNKYKIQINQNILGVYILIIALILGSQNVLSGLEKNYLIKTSMGEIYVNKNIGEATGDVIDYIHKYTKGTDKIVILPEGMLINFLAKRNSDDFYNSLIPLYLETFSEKNIINHFKQTEPDYIIFNNWDTKDYFFRHICNDYAFGFCSFVAENYTQEKVVDTGFRYLIFKRK